MKKRGFAKYLLTWLLALVMVVGTFSVGTAPVYAAETESTDSFNWPVVGDSSSYAYKIYFYYPAGSCYFYSFSSSSFFVESGNLLCSGTYYLSVSRDLGASWSKPAEYVGTSTIAPVSSMKDVYTTHKIYDFDCTVEYLPDATLQPDSNVGSGDSETPEDEATWKQVILDTIETWFGGTLEVIAVPLQAVAEGLGNVSTKILELRDYLVAQLPKGISNALSKFFENLDNSILDVFGLLEEFHNFCVDKSKEFISYFSSILKAIDESNRFIIDGIADLLVDLTPEAFKEVFRIFYEAQMEMLDDLKEFIISINDFMGNGFDTLKNLSTNFSSYVTKFFEFANLFLEFSVDNPVTQMIFAALRQFLEPLEDLFVDLFIPDKALIETEFAALREKLGFIDDLQTAGVYLLNFFKNLGTGTPPVININLGASKYRDLGDQVVTLDFSWYAEYKPTVDKLLAGIIWATFIWNMYKRLPDIIQGAGMISAGSAKIENNFLSRSDKSGGIK